LLADLAIASSKIARFHSADSTLNAFQIKTEDQKCYFASSWPFGRGSSIRGTDDNREFFVHFSQELGNIELGQSLLWEMKDEISVTKVASHLLLGNRFNLDVN
jgi:hypothetical protein